MSSSIKNQEEYKKRIGKYLISYCQGQYYGKSLHGEMRAGFEQPNNKLFIFRINPLPLSNKMKTFINLQKTYSDLKQYSRIVYEQINSSSTNYVSMEYFPKTFESQIQNFRKNPKYLDQMVQKFLKTYSFFYNMKVSHGNLIPSNIGITFDSKVKLMDFQILPQESSDLYFTKDFHSFKLFISRVLQKDSNYPYKFNSFNNQNNQTWEHLFGSWHITSPLQPVYLQRISYIQNIVTGLYKLQASLEQINDKFQQLKEDSQNYDNQSQTQQQNNSNISQPKQDRFILSQIQKLNDLKMSIRLLQLNYLNKSNQQRLVKQKQSLQQVIYTLQDYDLDYYNSVLIGAITDFQFYNIDPSRRLFLLSCLIPNLNHQFIYEEIVDQFKENKQNVQRNLLLGDSLFSKFKQQIFKNLLKKPKQKPLF